ncbi:MAG: PqqD family protein [Clostridia bacterium]|jgi:hypothetical protein|nr:PqqD family protein [Clostridia bacterium]
MKLNGKFILKNIGNSTYAVPLGEASKEIKGMIKLNETAAFIWKMLEKESSEEEIVSALISEFKATREDAEADLSLFISSLKEAKILVTSA